MLSLRVFLRCICNETDFSSCITASLSAGPTTRAVLHSRFKLRLYQGVVRTDMPLMKDGPTP